MQLIPSIKEKIFHAGFQKYFKNTGWLFLGKVVTLMISFFVGIYVARYLGPAQYGIYNYVTSFVGLFLFIASFGIDGIVTRELIKHPEKRDELLGTSLYIKLFGSIIVILLISIVSSFLNQGTLNLYIFLFSFSIIFQSFAVIDLFFQSKVLSKKTVITQLVSLFISSILKIAFIVLKLNVFWFTLVLLLESITLAIGFITAYSRSGLKISNWRFDFDLVKNLLKTSWPLMLAGAAVTLYMRIDQVMIKHMLNESEVGIYAVAVRLSEVWYFVPGIICSSLFPAIINAKKVSEELYLKRLKNLYSLMFWLSVGIALPVFFLSDFIIKILFGLPYAQAAGVLKIYIWAGVPVFLGVAVGQYLLAENYNKISFFLTLAGAVSNIFLNIIFIPKYGIIGSALATLISYSLATFLILIFKKTRGNGILMLKSILIK